MENTITKNLNENNAKIRGRLLSRDRVDVESGVKLKEKQTVDGITSSSSNDVTAEILSSRESQLNNIVLDKKKGVVGAGSMNMGYGYNTTVAIIQKCQRTTCCFCPDRGPCMIGADEVLAGQFSAAESVKLCGIKPPQYFWYMVSGTLCDAIQFVLDAFCNHVLHMNASTCWMVSFALSIIFRHTSHRYFVFGAYQGGYYQSLGRMYLGYSVIIVISTVFHIYMVKMYQFSHNLAWVITLLWTGIVNYFILKKLWSFNGTSSSANQVRLVA